VIRRFRRAGVVSSAIELARIVREVGFDTVVEERASCVSACFALYAAGFNRMGQLPLLRGDSDVTSIGVHRALIDSQAMKSLDPAAARAVVSQARELSSGALREFDVPEDIIQLVQNTPAAGVRYLTSGQLSVFMEPPWLIDLAHARCELKIPQGTMSAAEGAAYFNKLAGCKARVLGGHRTKYFEHSPG
jgi:hypothetical protein